MAPKKLYSLFHAFWGFLFRNVGIECWLAIVATGDVWLAGTATSATYQAGRAIRKDLQTCHFSKIRIIEHTKPSGKNCDLALPESALTH